MYHNVKHLSPISPIHRFSFASMLAQIIDFIFKSFFRKRNRVLPGLAAAYIYWKTDWGKVVDQLGFYIHSVKMDDGKIFKLCCIEWCLHVSAWNYMVLTSSEATRFYCQKIIFCHFPLRTPLKQKQARGGGPSRWARAKTKIVLSFSRPMEWD